MSENFDLQMYVIISIIYAQFNMLYRKYEISISLIYLYCSYHIKIILGKQVYRSITKVVKQFFFFRISLTKGMQNNVNGNGTYVNISENYICLSLCYFMTCTIGFPVVHYLAIKQWLVSHIHLLSDVNSGFCLQ